MATKQGMCRNCGSLVVFDDRDDTCECVFCHCVFPSAEADRAANFPDKAGAQAALETNRYPQNRKSGAYSGQNLYLRLFV